MSGTAIQHGSEDVTPLVSSTASSRSTSFNLEHFASSLSSTLSRWKDRITLDTLRPLPMFLGVSGPAFCISAQAFNPPSKRFDKDAPEKISSRIRLNFAFFLTNYALVLFGTAFVVALMHPAMLVSIGFVYGLWYGHFILERSAMPLVVGGIDLLGEIFTAPRRSLVLTGFTIIVAVFKCLVPFLEVVLISGVVIVGHAVLRDPKHIETCGEFSGRRHGSADSDSEEEFVTDDETVKVERGDVV